MLGKNATRKTPSSTGSGQKKITSFFSSPAAPKTPQTPSVGPVVTPSAKSMRSETASVASTAGHAFAVTPSPATHAPESPVNSIGAVGCSTPSATYCRHDMNVVDDDEVPLKRPVSVKRRLVVEDETDTVEQRNDGESDDDELNTRKKPRGGFIEKTPSKWSLNQFSASKTVIKFRHDLLLNTC
jgi:hypothetical protein